ncbi:hypothetical protein J2X71_001306 [Rhizobium sp. 1399]|nr:hypothetical protein [Rhizobium sp. 1399]
MVETLAEMRAMIKFCATKTAPAAARSVIAAAGISSTAVW